MSRIFNIISSVLLSAVVFIAVQTMPTLSVNHGLKVERVDKAIDDLTNFPRAVAVSPRAIFHREVRIWLANLEANEGPLPVFPYNRFRQVHMPEWQIEAAVDSGQADLVDDDTFTKIYQEAVPESKRRARRDPDKEDESPSLFDIM